MLYIPFYYKYYTQNHLVWRLRIDQIEIPCIVSPVYQISAYFPSSPSRNMTVWVFIYHGTQYREKCSVTSLIKYPGFISWSSVNLTNLIKHSLIRVGGFMFFYSYLLIFFKDFKELSFRHKLWFSNRYILLE